MPSKQVTDHQKAADAVTSAIDTHGAAVATELDRRLAPQLRAGEKAPDHALTLKLVSRWIGQTHTAYATADEANLSNHSTTAAPRHDRDAAVHAVDDCYRFQRDNVGSLYGDAGQVSLGYQDPPSKDPVVLVQQAKTAIERLRDPSIVLAAPKRRGATIDRKAFSDELEADLPVLEQALGSVSQQGSKASATQAAKDAAKKDAEHALSVGAALAHASFMVAGKEALFPRLGRPRHHAEAASAPQEAPAVAKKG